MKAYTLPQALERIKELSSYEDRGHTSLCCVLTRQLNDAGYGVITISGHRQRVHRVIYEHFVRPIPAGYEIDHLCRVRACCNPDHLEAVTHRENQRRGNGPAGIHYRQTHCVNGHEFNEENTIFSQLSGGRVQRRCRTCCRARDIARYPRRPHVRARMRPSL